MLLAPGIIALYKLDNQTLVKSGIKSGKRAGYTLLHLLAAFIFLIPASGLASQGVQRPTRQSSLEAFSKGDYENAYSQFSELLVTYPGDPIYKYYSGVCLVKLGRDPGKAATLLRQAVQASATVRSIPSDAHFWLGRALQMSGRFTEAVASYNLFTELNGKRAARDLGIPDLVRQCERNEGRLTVAEAAAPVKPPEEKKEIPRDDKVEPEVKKIAVKPAATDTLLPDYDTILSGALDLQYKADSLYRIAGEQKKGLGTGSYAERTKLKAEIAVTEAIADSLQKQADRKYNEAQAIMNITSFTEAYIPPVTAQAEKSKPSPEPPADKPVKDSVPVVNAGLQASPETIDIYSVFEVKDKAPDEKIPINAVIPKGLIYRIQVAVFRNPVAYSHFRGIVPVNGFSIEGKDLTVYYAGMFRRQADAAGALATVRKLGFRDAFIAALHEGRSVSSEKAALLERDWGNKPLSSITAKQAPADTVPPTLAFRVEVIRSAKPLKDDVLEGIKRIAGARGLEIVSLADKTMIYLIGTFITFESADEYADLLIRNGYGNARVSAWLGKKEIPLETAIELFEVPR